MHDWDSLAWQPEAALAGAASGSFASAGPPMLAPIESSEAFLAAYQDIRGRMFTAAEQEIAWAASLWMAAYNAREEALHGDTPAGGDALCRGDRVETATAITAEDQDVELMWWPDAAGLSVSCLAGYQVGGVDEVTVADVRQGYLSDAAIEVDQVSCGAGHDGMQRSQSLLRGWRSQLVHAGFEAEP